MNSKTLTLALALVMSGCATPAPVPVAPEAPKRPCVATFGEMARYLNKKYGEVVQASSINATGLLMVIYVNPKTSTWTMTLSSPNGQTCIVTAGTGWSMSATGEPA